MKLPMINICLQFILMQLPNEVHYKFGSYESYLNLITSKFTLISQYNRKPELAGQTIISAWPKEPCYTAQQFLFATFYQTSKLYYN